MEAQLSRWLPAKTPLWRVFWLYGVIPSNALWAVLLVLVWSGTGLAPIIGMAAVLAVYTGWILPAVWLAADNTAHDGYALMARALTVAWALNTLFGLGFLLVDLAA